VEDLEAVEVEFQKHQGILHWQVRTFVMKCPTVQYDDAFQIASLAFLRAYNTYNNKKKCKFSSYLTLVVRNELTDLLGKEVRRWKTFTSLPEDYDPEDTEPSPQCVEDFLEDFLPQLSYKAQTYVKDVLVNGRRYRPNRSVAIEIMEKLG